MNNQQTPLEKLISDKERIQRQCKRQEHSSRNGRTTLHRFRDLRLFIHSERYDSHRLGSRSTIYYDVGNQKSEKMVLKSLIQEKEITSNN